MTNRRSSAQGAWARGHVDWDDIKRLNKELKWIPGKCAYCNGGGNVGSNMVSQVPVDTT